eukprot:4812293-Pyramimonas_sp.AAC.1
MARPDEGRRHRSPVLRETLGILFSLQGSHEARSILQTMRRPQLATDQTTASRDAYSRYSIELQSEFLDLTDCWHIPYPIILDCRVEEGGCRRKLTPTYHESAKQTRF